MKSLNKLELRSVYGGDGHAIDRDGHDRFMELPNGFILNTAAARDDDPLTSVITNTRVDDRR